jgi:hypothetical protein
MADVQTSKVDEKLAPVNVGTRRVKIRNHGNHTILVWQLKPYLYNDGSQSWNHCLATLTMEGDATM